ncbi:GDYXXLXY domain-containing protein [Pelotomaculum propionicicum]|uniref:GDYXXLXY domain-containing protein n=1 Tax=Pelotomaculum propionicicum TaxID=258475 RepID=A0A4Y7RLU6_9FIRM|nr:GDYXXLXY domain-containing protein [Pelotomaculum propionicicum]TEB09652.1 hypothetical protein Pmgp_02961 [Pelotomaculum propionicicum]
MKRSYKIGIIVALQVLFLFSMIGFRHYTLSAGTPVLLKAAPVDPWDLFRGEYVMLEYDISWVRGEDLGLESYRRQDVYVVLEKGEKYWNTAGLYLDKPDLIYGQIFIKGETDYFDDFKSKYHVSYGIESYYVEEGTGRELQQAKGFDAQIKIDRFGNAVIEKITPP